MNKAQLDYLKGVLNDNVRAFNIIDKVINDIKYLIYKLEENIVSPVVTELKPATKDYFTSAEFFNEKSKIDADVLSKLNILRENWGAPLVISPLYGGIIRYDNSDSYHNYKKWGKVRAVDFFPQSKKHNGGIDDKDEMLEFTTLATKAGFKGVGIYPYFVPSWGVHLDNRPTYSSWIDTLKYPQHNYIYGNIKELLGKYT